MHAKFCLCPPRLQSVSPSPLEDSFLLGPGAHKVLFVSSRSRFSQSCIGFDSSTVELMAASSKRAYATLSSAVSRATADQYLCRRPSNTQRQVLLSLCGVSWCAQGFFWAFWASLVGMGFDCKCNFAPPLAYAFFLMVSFSLLNFSLCSWFQWIVFVCFIVVHGVLLKYFLKILYWINHSSPRLWLYLLGDYRASQVAQW